MNYRPSTIALCALTALTLAACAEKEPADEHPSAPAAPQQDAETPATEPDQQTAEHKEAADMTALTVTSTAFEHEAPIPREYTCDGADASPPLQWSPGPPGTAAYALIMDDPDAPRGTWVHWVAWNIPQPALVDVIPGNVQKLDDGTAQGTNSWPKLGYGGPCPPSGTHRYFFKIYALDTTLDLSWKTTKDQLLAAMQGHILAQGELMGTYQRQP